MHNYWNSCIFVVHLKIEQIKTGTKFDQYKIKKGLDRLKS